MLAKRLRSITFIVAIGAVVNAAGQSDDCSTATVMDLSTGSECVNGTSTNATSTNTLYGACNGAPANEVWYTFVTNGAQNDFQIDPGTMTNAEIVIYTGGCAGLLETCQTATGGNILNTSWGIPAGTQVWVGIMSNGGADGTFELCITSDDPPPTGGNACSGAIPVCEGTVVADMSPLGPSGVFPSCFGGAVNQDVWFTFEVLQGGTFEWTATPSGASSGVELDWALYDISGGCPGTEVDCNYNYDGGNNGPNGQVPGGTGEFNPPSNLAPGTYAIVVDFYSSTGVGTLDFTVGNGSAIIAPDADFTISPNTPTCGPSVTVSINNTSLGTPDWDYGDGTTYTGTNPPDNTYTTPGTYAITATIGGQCPDTYTQFVELYGPVTGTPSSTDETCTGYCDGSASIQASGGSGVYTYSWTPGGQTSTSINNLCPGTYDVTITDAVCGPVTETITVAAGTSCCLITNFTANTTACDPATNSYDITGTVEFTDPPPTGQLIIEDCNGNQDVYNAPFTSPQSYAINGVNADGAPCSVNAYFTDDVSCTQTINFTAPFCPCNMDFLQVNIGLCDPSTNTYTVDGYVEFTSAPATGQLIIEDCNGNQDVYNAPFSSPQTYTIPGLPSDGLGCDITAYFTDDPTCTINLTYTAPVSCACGVDIGTFTAGINGSGTNNYVLCDGDEFFINSNNDNTDPPNVNDPSITYDPGIWFLAFDCPPTVSPPTDINTDPCLLGVVGTTNGSFSVTNNGNGPDTVYYVPISMYSMVDGYYSATNSSQLCYGLGPVYEVVFLPPITTSVTEDCQDSTATVNISGGYAQVAGGVFTASNLAPASAYFVNNTTTNGGNIVIGGLVDGDNYSFDVVDDNGCPTTVTGGPFVGLDVVTVNPAGPFCDTDPTANMSATPSGGAWSGTCGGCINSTGTFNPATAGQGTHTIYYTSPGYCGNTDSTDIVVNAQFDATIDPAGPFCESDPIYTMTPTVDPGGTWSATCGACINAATGDFDPFIAGAGTHTITYTIGGNCGDTQTTSVIVNPDQDATINNPGGPFCLGYGNVTVTAVNAGGTWSATCGSCINSTSGVFDPASAGIGNHTITYTLPNPCGDAQDIVIEVVDNFDATITQVGPFCEDDGSVMLTTVDGGGTWSATCGACVDAMGNFDPSTAGPGTHTVTYDIPGNCGDTQTIDIVVNAVPTMDFVVDSASGCIPVTATFTDNSAPSGVNCTWDFGDGTTSTDCGSTTHTYTQPGCYDVTLNITTADGCSNSQTVTDMVCTYAYAVADFSYSPTNATVYNPEISFMNNSANASSYLWDFNGEATSTAVNPTYEFSSSTPGTYQVCLFANNVNNCPDSTCQTVVIRDEFVIYVPNAFTPDGDGINDVFKPILQGFQEETYNLMIFDRWGHLVFSTEHINTYWDGTVNGVVGSEKTDTYVWKIEVKDEFNKKHEFYGHVSLLR